MHLCDFTLDHHIIRKANTSNLSYDCYGKMVDGHTYNFNKKRTNIL